MPLHTEIIRDGKTLSLRWGGFHVTSMIYAIAFERDLTEPNENIDYPLEPQGLSPANCMTAMDYSVIGAVCPSGSYTLKRDHHFVDIMDGEVLHLKPGDKLRFQRTHKS
jgi:hypothetical protein